MIALSSWIVVVPVVLATAALWRAVRWSFVAAQPDEWLLRVRDGRLVDAGIGVSLWRLPGDVLARFSSTVQRVKFSAQAYTREHVGVSVDGFVLWTVSPEGDGPFHAFSRLGIANLDQPPRELRSTRHLLTTPQYHAFQALLVTELQRQIAALPLDVVLAEHGRLASNLDAGLQRLCASLGIVMTQVELSQARPLDPSVLHDLAAVSEEAVKEQASRVRAQTADRLAHLEIDAQAELSRRRIAQEHEVSLARVEAERAVEQRQALRAREAQLAQEQTSHEVAAARREREELDLAAALDRTRREAAAQRDAMLDIASAEERKSQAVRDHELGRHIADQMSKSLAAFREPRWISIGGGSPLGSVAGMVAGVREALAGGPSND